MKGQAGSYLGRGRAFARTALRRIMRTAQRQAAPAALVLVLACSWMLGGATRANLLQVTALELIGLAGLAFALLAGRRTPGSPLPRIPRLVLGLAFALVLLQLVPVPYDFWAALPGRSLAAEGLEMLGLEGGWRPLSVAPEYTLSGLLKVVPPVCALAIALMLSWRTLGNLLAWTALLVGVLSSGWGVAQAAGLLGHLYPWTNASVASGPFANANHQASFLLMCLPFVGAMAGAAREKAESLGGGDDRALLWGSAGLVIFLGVVIAGSLFGYLLAPFIIALTAIVASHDPRDFGWRKLAVGGGLSLAALGLVAFTSGFDELGDGGGAQGPQSRGEISANTIRAIVDHAPLGSGLGTFERVYPLYERGDELPATFVNNAHNEYLQLALEIGIPGVLLLLAGLAWLGGRMAAPWVSGREYGTIRRMKLAASVSLMVPLLHSIIDYPLRAPSVACLAAACVAMLLKQRMERKVRDKLSEDERLGGDQSLTASSSSGSP